MSKETGGPAFLALVADSAGYGEGFFYGSAPDGNKQFINSFPGMTLRDWFAGQALSGSMSIPYPEGQTITPESIKYDVALCYAYADAMLAERSKE